MTHERVDAALVEEIEVFDLGNRAQSQVDRVALLPQQFGKPLDQGDLGVFGHPNDESAAGARWIEFRRIPERLFNFSERTPYRARHPPPPPPPFPSPPPVLPHT